MLTILGWIIAYIIIGHVTLVILHAFFSALRDTDWITPGHNFATIFFWPLWLAAVMGIAEKWGKDIGARIAKRMGK